MGVLQDGQTVIGGDGAWKRLRNSAMYTIVIGIGTNGFIVLAYPYRHSYVLMRCFNCPINMEARLAVQGPQIWKDGWFTCPITSQSSR